MNWLAHLYLSESNTRFRLGNLLADVIKGKARQGLGQDYQQGFNCHRAIDRFTDIHPLFVRSTSRLPSHWWCFKGILVDIYYDHLLARQWDKYHDWPLAEFTREFYDAALPYRAELPQFAGEVLAGIIRDDRLLSYSTAAGIRETLKRLEQRISERVGKNVVLHTAVDDFEKIDREIAADFAEFFPQLINFINCPPETPALQGQPTCVR